MLGFTCNSAQEQKEKCTEASEGHDRDYIIICRGWYCVNTPTNLPTTVTIHTSMYVKPEIHTADMKKVTMNQFFQKLLLQSGVVRKSRAMMGRDKTQRIRFRSLSGTANTLFCSAGHKRELTGDQVLRQREMRPYRASFATFGNLIEAVQAEGQVREAGLVLEDPAVGSGAAVDPQAGVVAPAHQRLPFLLGAFGQAGAAGAQPPQHKLTDAEVKAQNHDVHHVDQEEAGGLIPERKKHSPGYYHLIRNG